MFRLKVASCGQLLKVPASKPSLNAPAEGETEGEAGKTLSTLPELNALPSLDNSANTETAEGEGEPIVLETPQNALPEALNSSSTSDVVAPTSVATPLTGDASEVTAPGTTAPPTLGAAPTDSSIDVVPPAEIQPPRVPTIGGGSADPIGTVAPPVGWESDASETVAFETNAYQRCNRQFTESAQGSAIYQDCVAHELKQDHKLAMQEIAAAIGSNASEEDVAKTIEEFKEFFNAVIDETQDTASVDILAMMLHAVNEESPGEALAYVDILTGVFIENHGGNFQTLKDRLDSLLHGGFLQLSDPRYGLDTLLQNEMSPSPGQRWASFESNMLSFDLPEGIDVQNPIARALLGISEGQTFDGDYGDRMSALFVVDVILTAASGGTWAAGRTGGRTAVAGGRAISAGAGDDLAKATGRLLKELCNSFSANTKVAAAAGAVAISSLAVGQEVYGYNETTDEVGLYEITATHVHDDPVIITLTVDPDLSDNQPGELIETTPEHPFYVLGEWINGEDLEVGMPLSTFEGSDLVHSGTVTSVERVEKTQTMYNLTVAEAHTFFVGEGEWLVHNTGKCPTGLKNSTEGLRNLFNLRDTGSIRDLSIIQIREHLLENGFTQGLNSGRANSGYLFTNSMDEQVRIMNRNGGWDIRVRNGSGNYLDEFGNVPSNSNPAHGITVRSY